MRRYFSPQGIDKSKFFHIFLSISSTRSEPKTSNKIKMKKLIACLVALTFVASCAKFSGNKETGANKYSAKKEESSKAEVKNEKKAEKKEKKAKVKKHGGSEVK